MRKQLSFVVPARNEEALIGEVLDAIVASIAMHLSIARENVWLPDTPFEIVVADDGSEDATPAIVRTFVDAFGVAMVPCFGRSCAAARNAGAAQSAGHILCFIDADTIIPAEAVTRILDHHEGSDRRVVLYHLSSREPGLRAWLWWTFWGMARHLPLARAKSMPGFMSCSRAHFDRHGPFDESVLIAEEWSLTGAAYRLNRAHFHYDRGITARTSSRRMELQPFGYTRTFLKWVAVVLFPSARTTLNDRIRHGRAPS
jgi:glycosyltransferase involved in cell wall biosynthesis